MTRNPSDRDHGWIETEEVKGSTPPWRKGEDGQSHRRQREPLNWPTAALGIAALLVLAFAAWICSGAAAEIWGAG